MASSIAGFLQNLSPGENIFDAIRAQVVAGAYPEPSARQRREVFVLLGIHILVLVLSVVGLAARYRRRILWVFQKDDNGLVRPNTAVATQICFAVYSVFYLIVAPTYGLKAKPSAGAFTFLVLSFTPLVLGLHVTVWATAFAPTTSMSFLAISPRSRVAAHGTIASVIAIGSAIAFLLSVIAPTVIMSKAHERSFTAVDSFLRDIDEAQAQNLDLASLVTFLPIYENLLNVSKQVAKSYRILTGTYFAWVLLYFLIYIPASIRLILSLRSRRRRFARSLRSLRVLDDIVTQDGPEQKDVELALTPNDNFLSVPNFPAPSSQPFGKSPGLTHAVQFSSPRDDADGRDSDSITTDSQFAGHPGFSEQGYDDVGGSEKRNRAERKHIPQPSRAQTHVEDLEKELAKAERMFNTIVIQGVVTTAMGISALAFCIVIFLISLEKINSIFLSWTGFTFALAGLFISTTFAIFSVRGPKIAPRSVPKPSPTPKMSIGNEFDVLPSPSPTSPSTYGSPSSYPPASPSNDGGASFAISRGPPIAPSAGLDAFAHTVEVLQSRLPSLDSARDASSANGRSSRDWVTARSASDNGIEMEEGQASPLMFVQPSPQPSPQARWVPSEWAAARRDKWGREEGLEETR